MTDDDIVVHCGNCGAEHATVEEMKACDCEYLTSNNGDRDDIVECGECGTRQYEWNTDGNCINCDTPITSNTEKAESIPGSESEKGKSICGSLEPAAWECLRCGELVKMRNTIENHLRFTHRIDYEDLLKYARPLEPVSDKNACLDVE